MVQTTRLVRLDPTLLHDVDRSDMGAGVDYLSIDFETRSTLDLTRVGVYRYAEHPTTSVICMAYAFGDGPVKVWKVGDPLPGDVLNWVGTGLPLRAFNAQFERVMWRDCWARQVGLRDTAIPDLEQWHCTAAEAMAMALPRSLGWCADVLNVPVQKDEGGRKLMLQMCQPRSIDDDGTIHWWDEEDLEKKAQLLEYCKQDVRTERAVAQRVRRLSDKERQVYLLDQKINDRGVRLDIPLLEAARDVVKRGVEEANTELAEITDGEVTKVTQVQRINRWVNEHGADLDNLRKATLRDTLADDNSLPEDTERVLKLRQEAGKTSNSKLDAMERTRCSDDRVRGLLLYHGASTGRWSGKLVQPQNLPRPSVDNPEQYIPHVLQGVRLDLWEHPPLEVISSLLRGMFVASPGCRIMAGDFSQIEARVLGWIANEPYGEKEYERMAAAIFRKPVEEITKDSFERQIGKNTILGCGFGMGSDRFQEQVWEQTGIEVSDEMSERAVDTYRGEKAGIPNFWNQIESAALRAVRKPGKVTHCGLDGQIRYVMRGQFLWCILPSGRPLAYALPQVRMRMTPWGQRKEAVTYMGINSYTRKWERMSTYGGHLTENVVQATARDILAEAMLRLDDAGYPLILTVHDEVVADVPEDHGSLDEFLEIMEQVPAWAEGCPIAAEVYEAERYRK